VVSCRGTLHGSLSSPCCLGVVSGFLLKLIRESMGFTQVQLATRLSVDVASVQGWESGRRPLAALRAVDLRRLRFQLLRWGAQPTLLDTLEEAIQADLVITDAARIGDQLVEADWHPLGAAVHRCKLSDLVTWPFTGTVPTALRDFVTVRVRRGPVRAQPTLTERERTCFFDHLLMIADAHRYEIASLARRQAIYLLGFDTRASTVEWLRVKQLRALRHAERHGCVPSWVVVRSSAVALAYGGDRDPLRAYLQHALTTDQSEQANLNYWAYWVGEIDCIQVNDKFMERVDPRSWNGVRLLGHLLGLLHPGSGHAELNLHTLWALLLTHPALLDNHPHLRSATARTIDELAGDHDLSVRARRELSDIAYAIRLAHR
jgi:transcriptional regulator with XRE-family HTH domain